MQRLQLPFKDIVSVRERGNERSMQCKRRCPSYLAALISFGSLIAGLLPETWQHHLSPTQEPPEAKGKC